MNDFHLLVDHLHHQADPRHPVLHAPDIRLGQSRPRRKPIKKVKHRTGTGRHNNPQRQRYALVRSAYEGDTTKVTQLLKKASKKQMTMLKKASQHRKQRHGVHRNSTALEFQKSAKRLNKQVLDVDAVDANGQSALSWACRQGHDEMVRTLLTNGAHVEHCDVHSGKTPLHHCAAGGYLHIVRILLDHDAKVSPQDKRGNTPLILAAQFGHDRVLFELLRAGARWDMQNQQNSDAMLVSKRLGHHHVLKVLKEHVFGTGEHYTVPEERKMLEQFGPTLQEQLELQTYSPERGVREREQAAPTIHYQMKQLAQRAHVQEMSRRQHHRHPTGFHRNESQGLESLNQVRWGADPAEKGIAMENEHKRSLVDSWDREWKKLSGETNVERLERLGERHNKIPGQCPHLNRGQSCYSMRELGTCEYLHIPDRPRIQLSFVHKF